MFSRLVPRVTRCHSHLTALRSFSFSRIPPPPGSADSFQQGVNASENVATGTGLDHVTGFPGRNSRSMDFVRGVIDQDGRANRADPQFQFPIRHMEQNADVVHIKLMRNNTFVTVTDSKGNKKLGASAGSVPEMKGGAKLSRYAAEATAEHVGRMSRNFGLKSVVMRVKGFTYFKKKKQAILSWKDGFTNSRVGQNPVIYIEDTTESPIMAADSGKSVVSRDTVCFMLTKCCFYLARRILSYTEISKNLVVANKLLLEELGIPFFFFSRHFNPNLIL